MKFNARRLNCGEFDEIDRLQMLEQLVALLIIENHTRTSNKAIEVAVGSKEEIDYLFHKFSTLSFESSTYDNGYALKIVW